MTTRTVKIGEHVHRAETWNPTREASGKYIHYVDLSSLDNVEKRIVGHQNILANDAPSRARQLILAGDILVSTVRPNLNGVARVPTELNGATASTGFCILRPNKTRLLPEYLFHWVQNSRFIADMMRKATGASYPAVSDRIVFDSEIPLPPIDEQRRIAAILDQADDLRHKRHQVLKNLDDLAQAIFVDMFGDAIARLKKWDILPFSNVAFNEDAIRIPLKSADRANRQGAFPYYGASGIIDRIDNYLFEGDRLLIAEDGANLINRSTPIAFIASGRYWVNNHAHVVRENGKCKLPYLEHFLANTILTPYISGSAQPKLNQSSLDRVMVPVPPVSIQEHFSSCVFEINRLKSNYSDHLSKINILFTTLKHRAFQGELTHHSAITAPEQLPAFA